METHTSNPTRKAREGAASNGDTVGHYPDHDAFGPTLGERLRQHWGKLLVLATVASLIAGALAWVAPLKYTSSVTVFVDARDGQLRTDLGATATTELMEVLFTATSTEVIDHLIDTFDLRAHYNIPATDPLAYARTYARTVDAIRTNYLDAQCLVINVRDRDRELAMHMANTIYRSVERIVQRRTLAALDKAAAVNASVLQRTVQRTAERTTTLRRMLAEDLAAMDRPRSQEDQERLERSLALLAVVQLPVAEMERASDQATELLAQAGQPTITLIRAALPDVAVSRTGTAVRAVLIAFLISLVAGVSFILVTHFHVVEVKTLLRSRSPR